MDTKQSTGEFKHTNRLIHEKSPYLLQHAHNPVDWNPWDKEALATAKRENKPIFLSIGYSTCHWCHVMERESFENEEIAAFLNANFVPIKVDREERPDLDNLYMTAVQSMGVHGGWPLSVFLTPDGVPFYGGTYYPPEDRSNMLGFPTLLRQIDDLWRNKRQRVTQAAEQINGVLIAVADSATSIPASGPVTPAILDTAYDRLASSFDPQWGGFGGAPKFPTPHRVTFLLRYHARTGDARALEIAETTLDRMAQGGMYDHLGGGFHRYSTDRKWLVPHFEKMLYDQAGLALAYTQSWQITGNANHRAVAEGTLDYVLAYLTNSDGGFLSAEDADSEGEEGKFYVWTPNQVREVLGAGTDAFDRAYGVSTIGNFEGTNILNTQSLDSIRDSSLTEARAALLAVRDKRIRPHRDDKVVTAWNAWVIQAFAEAGWAFQEPRYTQAAERAARFVEEHLWRGDRLLRHYRDGAADVPGYLEDYAYLGRAYVTLYETTFDPEYLAKARRLAADMQQLFARDGGGFEFTGSDAEKLLTPVVEVYDGAMPSGNSMAAEFLLELGHLTGDTAIREAGWNTIRAFAGMVEQEPVNYLEMLSAADFALGPNTEVVVAGDASDPTVAAMWNVLRAGYRPNAVLAYRPVKGADRVTGLIPYLEAQIAIDGKPTAYVCRNYACKLPVHDAPGLEAQLLQE